MPMTRDAAFGLWVAVAIVAGTLALLAALLLGANPLLCLVLLVGLVLSAMLALLLQHPLGAGAMKTLRSNNALQAIFHSSDLPCLPR